MGGGTSSGSVEYKEQEIEQTYPERPHKLFKRRVRTMDEEEKTGLRWLLKQILLDVDAGKISDWYIESETRTTREDEEKELIIRVIYPKGEEKEVKNHEV